MLPSAAQSMDPYRDAIARAEQAVGRAAPEALARSRGGAPQLSARFVEWLMMLPDGWVTGVPGASRAKQLRALGNGVVPAQAAAALRAFLAECCEDDQQQNIFLPGLIGHATS